MHQCQLSPIRVSQFNSLIQPWWSLLPTPYIKVVELPMCIVRLVAMMDRVEVKKDGGCSFILKIAYIFVMLIHGPIILSFFKELQILVNKRKLIESMFLEVVLFYPQLQFRLFHIKRVHPYLWQQFRNPWVFKNKIVLTKFLRIWHQVVKVFVSLWVSHSNFLLIIYSYIYFFPVFSFFVLSIPWLSEIAFALISFFWLWENNRIRLSYHHKHLINWFVG